MVSLFWLNNTSQDPILDTNNASRWDISVDISDQESQIQWEIGQLSLDILENHEALYILAPVAGIMLHDIDISVQDTTLVISWVRNKPREFFEFDIKVKNEECFWGRFQRKIILPENLDFSAIKAVMEYNLLVIHIPKLRFTGQKVQIHTSN